MKQSSKTILSTNSSQDVSPHDISVTHTLVIRKLSQFRSKILKKYKLSTSEWYVLGLASDNAQKGGIRVTDIARMIDVKTTYITAALNQLRKEGLIQTQTHAQDGRARLIVATPKGVELIAQIEKDMGKQTGDLLEDNLLGNDVQEYFNVLQKMTTQRLAS